MYILHDIVLGTGKDGPQSSERGPEETEARVRTRGRPADSKQTDLGVGVVSDLDSMSPAWTGCIPRSLQSRGFLVRKSPHWATLGSSAEQRLTLLFSGASRNHPVNLPLISRTVYNSVLALICSSTNSPDHQSVNPEYLCVKHYVQKHKEQSIQRLSHWVQWKKEWQNKYSKDTLKVIRDKCTSQGWYLLWKWCLSGFGLQLVF